MKNFKTATQPVATAREPGRFDPSTWAGQARNTARNTALARTLLVAVPTLFVLALGTAIMRQVLGWPWSWFVGDLALAVALATAVLLGVYIISYALTLQRDTQAVRAATWQRELALGVDLDGDGRVGQPEPVGHVVRINGAKPAEVVLPNLNPPRQIAPLVEFPASPAVTANDVIYVLSEAARRGLTFRAWERQRLPSGAEIDRALWVGIQDGLLSWTFAVASTDARGRRRVELRGDIGVEAMIHAVRAGVGMDQTGAE